MVSFFIDLKSIYIHVVQESTNCIFRGIITYEQAESNSANLNIPCQPDNSQTYFYINGVL